MDLSRIPEYVMNTLCRICAEKSSKLIPIFKQELLSHKIDKCLPIKVTETDHLPLNVCESCLFRIDENYLLYETAHESDQKLKKLWRILLSETLNRYADESLPVTNQSKDDPGKINVGDWNGEKIDGVTNEVIGKTVSLEITKQNDDRTLVESRIEENQIEQMQQIEISKPVKKIIKANESKQQTTKIYQCQFCSRQVTTLSSLSIHESTHSQQKSFLCDTCGKSFKHANNLRCHAKIHLGVKKKHMCKICSKGFLTNFFLQEHMNSHTGETPYKCGVCGKEFRQKVHLHQHKWTHSEGKFSCPICQSKFNRKGNMNEHIKKFHQNKSSEKSENSDDLKSSKNFSCPACNDEFPNLILLKNHLKLHPEQKIFSCLICGKKFRHSGSMTYHRRTAHTGEKPFQCSYCDQRFFLRSVQRIHERKIHTFERPYKCSICPRLFTNSSSLRNHLYVHSKNKMFECEECGKKFSRSSNLFVHKKLHTDERRFACDQCGKSYIQKCDMVKHKRVHDPKSKPFFCKYCGNYFSSKKDSAKHQTCQFDFLRRNNPETFAAEKILDSVSSTFRENSEEFFRPELISESAKEEISGGKSCSGYDENHLESDL